MRKRGYVFGKVHKVFAVLLGVSLVIGTVIGSVFGLMKITSTDTAAESTYMFADGYYTVMSSGDQSYALDVSGGSGSDGANVQIYKNNYSAAQQFYFDHIGSGVYVIYTVSSGKKSVLDVAGNINKNGTNVQQYTYNGTSAQKWTIQSAGNGSYYFVNVGTGKVLDIAGNDQSNKTNIQIYTKNNTSAQKFFIKSTTQLVSNGWYTMTSAGSTGYVIDVSGGSTSNGANVQAYKSNSSAAQKFYVKYLDNGEYYVGTGSTNAASVLDVAGNETADGTNVQQYKYNGTTAQRWRIIQATDGSYAFLSASSGKGLNISGSTISNNSNISIYSYSGGSNQRFNLTSTSLSEVLNEITVPTVSSATVATGKTFIMLSAADTAKGLDIEDSAYADNTNVQIWTTGNYANNKKFRFVIDSNGYYTIVAANSEKALKADSSNVFQYKKDGTNYEKWEAVKNTDGSYSFRNVATKGYLSIANAEDGANVGTASSNTSQKQRFVLKSTSYTQEIDTGCYSLSVAQDTSYALTVDSCSPDNNTKIYSKSKSSGAVSQMFGIYYLGDGIHQIKTGASIYKSGVSVLGSSITSGAYVGQYTASTSTNAQKWRILKNSDGYVFMSVGGDYVMTVSGNTVNGGALKLAASSNSSKYQQFSLSKTSGFLVRKGSYGSARKYYFNTNGDKPQVGVDISFYQGDVDWEAVKNDDIDFAIIRMSYSTTIKDSKAERNLSECERLGIPYGVYFYSTAVTNSQADAEVTFMRNVLGSYKPDLGVFIDIEDTDSYEEAFGDIYSTAARTSITNLTKRMVTKVKAAGYDVGIYANQNYFTSVLYTSQLTGVLWIANYFTGAVNDYNKLSNAASYNIWQYSSSSGIVDGIDGSVDMNTMIKTY